MNVTVEFFPAAMSVEISSASIETGFENQIAREAVEREPYEGSYTITPGNSEIVLATKNKRMTDDVTVAPIPSNYGLITWNGSVITVS